MTNSAFDPAATAGSLWRLGRQGTLASLSADGKPFASLVGIAPDCRTGTLVLLLSDLAVHTANLKLDPRASMLIVDSRAGAADAPGGADDDPLTLPRLTLVGEVTLAGEPEIAAALYLDCHSGAAGYAGFNDFRFYRFAPQSAHLVAGFGRIADIDPAIFAGG